MKLAVVWDHLNEMLSPKMPTKMLLMLLLMLLLLLLLLLFDWQDVVYALAHATGKTGRFTLIERWRNNERLLAPHEHPLKVTSGFFFNFFYVVCYYYYFVVVLPVSVILCGVVGRLPGSPPLPQLLLPLCILPESVILSEG